MSILLQKVTKIFQNKKVIDEITTELYNSEVTFIVGRSGAGKTTLLNLIGTLEKLDFGNLEYIYGEKHQNTNDTTLRQNLISFIFQDYNLIEGLSIYDNIIISLNLSKKSIDDKYIEEITKKLLLPDLNQKVETLSGGEKQRVAIARAVIRGSKIILADEPTGNLDTDNAKIVFELLREIMNERYIIVVSHDLEYAEKYGDRILTIDNGKIIDDRKIIHKGENIQHEIIIAEFDGKLGNRFKKYLVLTKNSVKHRLSRFLIVTLITSIAISFIALTISLYVDTSQLNDNLNKNYLETDLISVIHDGDRLSMYPYSGMKPFTQDEISSFSSNEEIKEVTSIYMYDQNLLINNNSTSLNAEIRQIEINDFYITRIMSYDIEGHFIENNEEIIIGAQIADVLFPDGDILGSYVSVADTYGHYQTVKIVGINKTFNAEGQNLSFVTSELIRQIENQFYSSFGEDIEVMKYRENESNGIVDVSLGVTNIVENNESIAVVHGRLPLNENEVLISSRFYDFINSNDKEVLFQTDYYIQIANAANINIVGVYEGDFSELMVSSSLYNFLSTPLPRTIQVFIDNPENSDGFISELIDGNDYIAMSVYQNLRNNVSSAINHSQDVMLIISILLFLIFILLVYGFVKILITERTHEIGILKSLGANNREIYFILLLDMILFITVSFIASIPLSYMVVKILPIINMDYNYFNLSFPILYQSLMTIMLIAMSSIIVYLHTKTKLCQTVSSLLRNKV